MVSGISPFNNNVIINNSVTIKALLKEIAYRKKILISKYDLDSLSKYLEQHNYYSFRGTKYSNNQIRIAVFNTKEEFALIVYDYRDSSVMFIDDNVMIDFTNKIATYVYPMRNSKIVLFTLDDMNMALYYNAESSSHITIGKSREILVPAGLEPDKIFDLSEDEDVFSKLIHLELLSRSYIIDESIKGEKSYGQL